VRAFRSDVITRASRPALLHCNDPALTIDMVGFEQNRLADA
jgi:hypothetical protein